MIENRTTLVTGERSSPARAVRVAHLSSSRTAGTITAKYAQALIDVGAEVQIFSPNTIRAHELHCGLVETSAPVVMLPFGKRALVRPEYYLSRLRLMAMAADVIIAEDPELLNFATKYARVTGARLVYMPFEYYPGASYATRKLERRWLRIERRCSPTVAAWIVLGDKVAELYTGVLAPAEAVHVVYAGWPRVHAGGAPKLRRVLGVGPEVKILLYQGGVQEKRGLWDVLEAMLLLPSHVHFAVLGMGELDRLRQDALARGLAGRVHILNAVPQAELVDYTKDADVGLIPIRNTCISYDLCSPGKLFEYIGAGLPLAVSRLTQLEWFVTRHGLGEVFDLESPPALARAVLRLLEDDAYREDCRRRCRELHETAVCWEVQVEKLRRAVLGPHYPGAAPVQGAARPERESVSNRLDTACRREPPATGPRPNPDGR